MCRPIILALLPHYLPGYKSGGPIRTIANTIEQLGDEFRFRIITSDRDETDQVPYPGIKINTWNPVGNADVYYASPQTLRFSRIIKLLQSTQHELVYLNSYFHPRFSIIPLIARRFGMVPERPWVIAPRGQLDKGALGLKAWKKHAYIRVAMLAGLHRRMIWQASNKFEAEEINRWLKVNQQDVVVAENVPPKRASQPDIRCTAESCRATSLRITFLSRIARMKNLDFALRVMSKVRVPVKFNIYGPIGEIRYWHQCKEMIERLPENIDAKYLGPVVPAEVAKKMAEHDLLFLPTRGENYGHVIPEALCVGTPVLVSDATPWRNLADAGLGVELPLDGGEEKFVQYIEYLSGMSDDDRTQWREKILSWAEEWRNSEERIRGTRELFVKALREGASAGLV